jgi:hypothetical protein
MNYSRGEIKMRVKVVKMTHGKRIAAVLAAKKNSNTMKKNFYDTAQEKK